MDLVILTNRPQRYLETTDWVTTFGPIAEQAIEYWGEVTSVRVWYESGEEVEFGITTPAWVAHPLDEGTRRTISEGMRILFDREGILADAIREYS